MKFRESSGDDSHLRIEFQRLVAPWIDIKMSESGVAEVLDFHPKTKRMNTLMSNFDGSDMKKAISSVYLAFD